ncbi:tyrosine-type recombinase/integrase [Lelliottia wanjuensis]|uniref:tyrosine-type recombinase/integrase n=1 Tax=Lelliottia wanjuensis TaxID=3050585 RepID=UPI00254F160C|nr:site-specific integrase [Lelliottia sp. V104_15]MDK9605521.1 site-specific integrase [Lelliottia sp. V104_15]
MAHIRERRTGRFSRFIVGYRVFPSGETTKASFHTLDEAMCHLWRAEVSERQLCPVSVSVTSVPRWPLRKAQWFWLGCQYEKVEQGITTLSSYRQYCKNLSAVPGALQEVAIGRLTPLQLSSLSSDQRKHLRPVLALLVSFGWLPVNPIGRLSKPPERKIVLPAKAQIRAMLSAAAHREKIAIILGAICGLRISEVVSLRYSDISRKEIELCRHLTTTGERAGTKRKKGGRTIDMPQELWSLLDVDKVGRDIPLISGPEGKSLSLNYSKRGVLRDLLSEFGVERFHDLRHFAITNALRRGKAVADVAKFAGHKDPSLTLRKYSHFLVENMGLTGSLEGE